MLFKERNKSVFRYYFSNCVHKNILYICLNVPNLVINLFLVFFYVLHNFSYNSMRSHESHSIVSVLKIDSE